jgi:hypothetical protein
VTTSYSGEPVILVGGWIDLSLQDRDKYIELSLERMEVAQRSPGCLYYVVVADPTNPERARVFEHFVNAAAFDEHLADVREGRAPGPPQGLDVKGRQIVTYEAFARPAS